MTRFLSLITLFIVGFDVVWLVGVGEGHASGVVGTLAALQLATLLCMSIGWLIGRLIRKMRR